MVWASCHNGIQEISSHRCITHWSDETTGINYFITKVNIDYLIVYNFNNDHFQVTNMEKYSCYSYYSVGEVIVVEMLGNCHLC